MADDFTYKNASGVSETGRAEEIAGKKYGAVKVYLGDVNVNDGPVSGSNPMPVEAASLPLPTGAATAANQATANASLSSVDGKLPALSSGRVPVDGSGVTQPVSAASLPLPTGAATAAKQPALGTAGSPSTDVVSIQGVVSGTAVPVSLASVPSHAVTNAGTFAVQNNAATPAGTNLIGRTSASAETSTVYDGTTALTPKFAVISASSSGNNTLVSAVTSKKIRVLAYNFIANGTVNAKFQSGAGGTDITGLKYCVANSGLVANFNPAGWFETASNTLLNINLSAAVAIGGELTYVEV